MEIQLDNQIRSQIIAALEGANAEYVGSILQRDTTRVAEYKAAFFAKWKILRVECFIPGHPILFYLGVNLPEQALLLSNDPEAFRRMVLDDGLSIESSEVAVDYFKVFIETTRPMKVPHYFVESVEEVGFLSKADQLVNDARGKLGRIIQPIQCSKCEKGFDLVAFGISNLDLIQYQATVLPVGTILLTPQVIEKNLPLKSSL